MDSKPMAKFQIIIEYAARLGFPCRLLEIGVDYGDTWHHCKGPVHDYTGVDIDLSRVTYPINRESDDWLQAAENYVATHMRVVDPGKDPRAHWFEMNSLRFWELLQAQRTWSLIFIDGDHVYETVAQDICRGLEHLAPQGYMLIHDVVTADGGPLRVYKELCEAKDLYSCSMIPLEVHDLGIAVIAKGNEQ